MVGRVEVLPYPRLGGKMGNEINLKVERVGAQANIHPKLFQGMYPDEGLPFTYILQDGRQEHIVNFVRLRGMGVTRPVSNTQFRLRMGTELHFMQLYSDLLNEMAHTGVWGSLVTPTNAVAYEFERAIILTPGTPITYETVLGSNTTNMNLWLRGEIINERDAQRTLTYVKTYDLNTTNYTPISFPLDIHVLSMLFYDIVETEEAGVKHYTIVAPANVPQYNQLAQYIAEVFVKRGGYKYALNYGIDRWCNYSAEYIHKKIKFVKPPLLRKETDQLIVKLNPDPSLGAFTPETGTWMPQVAVEYKIAPSELM